MNGAAASSRLPLRFSRSSRGERCCDIQAAPLRFQPQVEGFISQRGARCLCCGRESYQNLGRGEARPRASRCEYTTNPSRALSPQLALPARPCWCGRPVETQATPGPVLQCGDGLSAGRSKAERPLAEESTLTGLWCTQAQGKFCTFLPPPLPSSAIYGLSQDNASLLYPTVRAGNQEGSLSLLSFVFLELTLTFYRSATLFLSYCGE